jgi:hypothetical protein
MKTRTPLAPAIAIGFLACNTIEIRIIWPGAG